jgi:hypothetical protein
VSAHILSCPTRHLGTAGNPPSWRSSKERVQENLTQAIEQWEVVTTDTLLLNCFEVWLAPSRRASAISEMDQGSLIQNTPSLCVFKPYASEASDAVVMLMSETYWTSVETKSQIIEQRIWCDLLFGVSCTGCCSSLKV